ncbi:MAG: transketolase [Myxococcota bacterium]|nr:transketolase [Myxococcota bacterium]
MSQLTPELRERIHNTIRFLAVDAVEKANSGHPGAPMGLAPVALAIWDGHLRFDPTDPAWPLRDRFVLSAGHASMLLYSLLHLYGYDVPMAEIERFRQLGARTPGHPEYGDTPGVETTTGPLGQGIANAVGLALAARMTRARFGRDGEGPGHHRVYGICSDGDLMEGISAEAGSLAGHLGLGNLVLVYDDNRITIDGTTEISMSEDVAGRFEAQRWHVQQVDGLDVDGVHRALDAAKAEADRPSLIIARTTIGFGSPGKANTSDSHGAALGPDEVRATKENLGWPQSPPFLVPDDVRTWFDGRIAAKRAEREACDARLDAWRAAHRELAESWERQRERRAPDGLTDALAEGWEGVKAATRKHSGTALNRVAELAPYLIGGSADLAGSNVSTIKGADSVGPAAMNGDPFAGSNLHFGVREHGMGGIVNGIALDGTFLPYAATFLVFSDYMRPSIRLAALMGLRTLYVFTHDSIFLGEDGPTHQPVEQLDALRAIPNLAVFRPADGLETGMAWAWALERACGPAAFCLTRQGVPALDRPAGFAARDVWRGAYAVVEPAGRPDAVLLASGSEVSLVCDAADKLATEGVAVRVVSAPCLELLAEQPEDYRQGLLPQDGTPILAVEAALGESLRRWIGPRGAIQGIGRFGASAPAGDLAEEFGFTPDAVVARLRTLL